MEYVDKEEWSPETLGIQPVCEAKAQIKCGFARDDKKNFFSDK